MEQVTMYLHLGGWVPDYYEFAQDIASAVLSISGRYSSSYSCLRWYGIYLDSADAMSDGCGTVIGAKFSYNEKRVSVQDLSRLLIALEQAADAPLNYLSARKQKNGVYDLVQSYLRPDGS